MISGLHCAGYLRRLIFWGALAVAIFTIAAPAALCQTALPSPYPLYTAQSIVHGATQIAEALAPNTIATIYGTNLANSTVAVSSADVVGSILPTTLGGVSVIVGGYYASIFFVSPTQVNFLIPYNLTPVAVPVILTSQGLAGPPVTIQLNATAPGMFLYNGLAIATHLNGSLISAASPAAAGEIIIIYVAGLGRVTPDTIAGRIVAAAASISAVSQMQVLLAGKACPAANVLYAGLAPGFAGLYQINLLIPSLTAANPEIRISVGTAISPPAVQLALQ